MPVAGYIGFGQKEMDTGAVGSGQQAAVGQQAVGSGQQAAAGQQAVGSGQQAAAGQQAVGSGQRCSFPAAFCLLPVASLLPTACCPLPHCFSYQPLSITFPM
jgi:hypothetical protein